MKKVPWQAYAIGSAVLLFLLNFWFVQAGLQAFQWCAVRGSGAVLSGWWQLATLAALAWMVWKMFQHGASAMLWAAWPAVLLAGAPAFLEVLLGLGASDRCS